MKNLLIIDIGTHKAQELRVLNGEFLYLFCQYFYWWIDWLKRQIKKTTGLKGIIIYGNGRYKYSPINIKVKEHLILLKNIFLKKNHLSNFRIISIDPLFNLTPKYLAKLKSKNRNIIYFPVSIKNNILGLNVINEFFIPSDSLSASLWEDKDFCKKEYCISVSFEDILLDLKYHKHITNDTIIVLRMNCEGSEKNVLEACNKLNIHPSFIIGSIGDIEKKWGKKQYEKTLKLLDKNNIEFFYFKGTDPGTWFNTIKNLKMLLDKKIK